MRRHTVTLTILFLVIGLLVACGGDEKNESSGVPDDAALKITGKVDSETGWTEEEIRAMDTIDVESTNSRGEIDTYTGVPIAKLLAMADVDAGASKLVFVGDDGTTGESAVAKVLACKDCIVSFRTNGGFSIVLPGFPGKAQVKGVVEIRAK
jgi:DMSO/TMAO reductase YedYZ molybdopterin-dependent catalytic subunit